MVFIVESRPRFDPKQGWVRATTPAFPNKVFALASLKNLARAAVERDFRVVKAKH